MKKRVAALVSALVMLFIASSQAAFITSDKGVDLVKFTKLAIKRAIQLGTSGIISNSPDVAYVFEGVLPHAYVEGWIVFFEDEFLVVEKAEFYLTINPNNTEETTEEIAGLIPGLSAFEYSDIEDLVFSNFKSSAMAKTYDAFMKSINQLNFTNLADTTAEEFLYNVGDYRVVIKKNKNPESVNGYVVIVTLQE